jgi:glycosyltransferase involved in cell wall biosynthesis
MLKILIDATPISPKPSGVGFYVASLIQALSILQSQEDFQLGIAYQPGLKNWLRGEGEFPDYLKLYPELYFLPLPIRLSNLILDNFPSLLPFYFERHLDSPNIVHGTNYNVYPYKKSIKIMSLYDISFIKYPQYTNSVVKTYARRVKQCLQWTDLIISISESSKNDIIKYLHVPPAHIYVTPLASRYYPNYLSPEIREQLKLSVKYDFSKPYILFVSTIEPRKNIKTIISAYNFLKQKYKIEHQLVLIGQKGWHHQPIFAAIESSHWRSQIHHLDYLSDELVALFYSKAEAFVYPSYYEGFGLPVLEAMTLGAPVITSNTSSLPEVAGDAALFVNPDDPMDLVDAILQIISDSNLRHELIEKGHKRAKLFSWERTARETLKAYKSLVK